MSTHSNQLDDAEKAIKAGWIAACVSLGMTTIIMLIGMFSSADLGPALNGGAVLIIDVVLLAILAFFIYLKSRTAATIMFVYFLSSKLIQFAMGDFSGIFVGVVFLFFYGRAVWGTFTWHKLKSAADVSVFDDPTPNYAQTPTYAPGTYTPRRRSDGPIFKK